MKIGADAFSTIWQGYLSGKHFMTLKASQSSNHSPENGAPVPIVTDLDGTLIRTDSLYEGLAAALSANLFNLFSLLKFSSPLALKEWVEKYAKPDAFPVNQKVYETLKDAKNSGRSVWLATGSPDFVARPIAEKLEIFDGVISSTL